MGKIVTLGEVVADVYWEEEASEVELPFTALPSREDLERFMAIKGSPGPRSRKQWH